MNIKKTTNRLGVLCTAAGLIPVILLLVGVAEIAIAIILTRLGFEPNWFAVKNNLWVRMMQLAYEGDVRIAASFVFLFIGLALLVLADNMSVGLPKNT